MSDPTTATDIDDGPDEEAAPELREGANGWAGDEDAPPEPEEPEEAPPADAALANEDRAAAVYHVCRNLWNTVDVRPNGYAWFSA